MSIYSGLRAHLHVQIQAWLLTEGIPLQRVPVEMRAGKMHNAQHNEQPESRGGPIPLVANHLRTDVYS